MKKWYRCSLVCERRKFVALLLGAHVYLLMEDGTTIKHSRAWLAINKKHFTAVE
ncbi:hypothetical protein J9874_01558 [Duffyella gerundensis]|jgi:hypothetical protein|uniref:hypothetical protein n=1 Tax=Duffyella gerundensis TaxID=1619313 RepID=UPI0016961893|nr:hypothetical protein [Duffyella gerundensis]QTO55787.1 hypothetical protein J8I88_08050 [Duffyella gerundensis]UCB31026.1 hypothetical protein J9874_01558 [Duffyella gerundensis]